VIKMGDFSTELCGGTHVSNTAAIRMIRIVGDSGVSAGVRRVEAITGDLALTYFTNIANDYRESLRRIPLDISWQQALRSDNKNTIESEIIQLKAHIEALEKHAKKAKLADATKSVDEYINSAKTFSHAGKTGKLILAEVDVDDRQVLAQLADQLRDKSGASTVVVIVGNAAGGGTSGGSNPIIVNVSKDIAGPINAGKILAEVAGAMGGKGGGRPDFAQGAAPDRSQLAQAFAKAELFLNN
jgi:alanyl-tRNA synthetase